MCLFIIYKECWINGILNIVFLSKVRYIRELEVLISILVFLLMKWIFLIILFRLFMFWMSLFLLIFYSFIMLLVVFYEKKCNIDSFFRKYLFYVNSLKIIIFN